MKRVAVHRLGPALALLPVLAACSSDSGEGDGPDMFMPGVPGVIGTPTTLPPADPAPGVSNYERPLGMPIGQAVADDGGDPGADEPTAAPDEDVEADGELEIPVFTPADEPPPCSGCVELSLLVNDINQRAIFAFDAAGANVTRVVWTLIVPFNSDQLFVQPYVDNSYGTYTDLDANAFAINTPVQLVHEYAGTARTVGIAVGSSGAWTGNMTMSVFVDSVMLEGADPSASRTFDTDQGGFVAGANLQNPQIVYHP